MKISEISLSQDIKQARISSDVAELLSQYGWKFLGKGDEAAVAQHPNKEYVLKVFESQSMFQNFYQLCQTKPNIHYPKFLSKIKIVPQTKSFWSFVRMEKLTPIKDKELLGKYFAEVIYTLDTALKLGLPSGLGGGMNYVIDMNVHQRFQKKIWNTSDHKLRVNDEILHTIYPMVSETWKTAVNQVAIRAAELGLNRLDLHSNNFMTRGNTLVILDPFN